MKPSHLSRQSAGAQYAAAIGKEEYRSRHEKFKNYQATQHVLTRTASQISKRLPQHRHPLALLFLQAVVAPMSATPPLRPLVAGTAPGRQNSLASATPSNVSAALPDQTTPPLCRAIHAILPLTSDIAPSPPPGNVARLRIKRDTDTQSQNSTVPAIADAIPALARQNIQDHSDDDAPTDIQLENKQVIQLLKEQQKITDDIADVPDNTMLKAAIRFFESDAVSMQLLASRLQQANARYGGNPEEPMSPLAQKNIICDWLTRNFLLDDLSSVLQEEIMFQGADVPFTNADLNQFVIKTMSENADEFSDINAALLQYIFIEELPTVGFFYTLQGLNDPHLKQLKTLDLHDFRWGQLHAGLRFAQSLGVAVEQVSIQQAFQLGLMLHTQLQEGTVPQAWWAFFKLPALIRHTQDFPQLVQATPANERVQLLAPALLHYEKAFVAHQKKHNPVQIFNEAMVQYQTRPQIASAIISKLCPGLATSSYLTMKTLACINVGGVYVPVPAYKISPLRGRVELPCINDLYEQHVGNIADTYGLLDKLLLLDALDQLESEDFRRWSMGLIKPLQIDFSAAHVLNSRPFVGNNQHARESQIVRLDEAVEFFQTELPPLGKQIYALRHTSNGYIISRVGDAAQDYFAFLTKDQRPVTDVHFKLRIHLSRAYLKTQKQELHVFLDKIVNTHRQTFFRKLHEFGYEKTSAEKVGEFLLGLIPFYTCVSSAQAGNTNDAIIACGMDAINLLPIIGRFSSLSFKISNMLGKGGLIAARNAASQIAAHNTLRLTLQRAGKEFVRYGLLPASVAISKKEIRSLGLVTLRSIDPGFELIGQLGAGAVRQFIKLSNEIAPLLQQLQQLFPKVTRELEQVATQNTPGTFVSARLPSHDKQVSVTKLGGDQYQNRDIYVQVNPDTGEPFGRKYVLGNDGILEPVPPGLARRMRNILEYGLSGKNAPRQGAAWASQRTKYNPITHTVLRQIQLSVETGGDLQQLAAQLHVAYERLLRFIVPSGELTALGRHLFALAEAADISTNAIPVRPYSVMQLPRQVLSSPFVRIVKPSALTPEQLVIALLDSVEPDLGIADNFAIRNGRITTEDNSYFTYDIDLDVFVKNRSDESPFVYIVDKETKQLQMITPEQARQRAASVSVDERTAVIKALGIDLDLASAISHSPAMPGPQLPILKRISFIWIGNKPISQAILANLVTNCQVANMRGYKVYFYLSEQSKELNYQELSEVICGPATCDPSTSSKNQIKILEKTKFFADFKLSVYFDQYEAALIGDGKEVTHFAAAADILRYNIIKEKGGLYMDVDDTLTDEIGEEMLKVDADGLVLPGLLSSNMPPMDHLFGTSFFGAHQNSKTLDAVLREIHRRYKDPVNQAFYQSPRPSVSDVDGIATYADKLSYLTGPEVFNHVLLARSPALKHFRAVSLLEARSHRPYSSHLFSEIMANLPDIDHITPLANSYVVGNLHSWKEQRRRR